MADIVCLGEPMVEFAETGEPGLYRQGIGGDVSNVAIAAARQGAAAAMMTAIGTDAFGDALMAAWAAEGVDAGAVRRVSDAPTGIYFIGQGPDGPIFTYARAGSAASRMTPDDLDEETIRRARVLHVSGISLAIGPGPADAVFRAIAVARAAGVRVSVDTNLRLSLWPLDRARAVIHGAVAGADLCLPGLDDARRLTGQSDPDAICDTYLALGPSVVALTLGAEGALVATPAARWRLPAPAVAAVDTSGAGDCFDGAFLAETVAGRDPSAAGRYAVAAAALSACGHGAVTPIPRRAAVAAALG
jgi:2-dehydro-3-deoxygluconokinase